MEQQALLSNVKRGDEASDTNDSLRSYQYIGRMTSFNAPSRGGDGVSVDEVRSASVFSDQNPPNYYPPSIHSGLLTPSVQSDRYQDQAIVHQGGYGGDLYGGFSPNQHVRPALDAVEVRQLLIDHVGHRCCWASQPARKWSISAIEDCNVYVGTLETFIEEREVVKETEPYEGGKFDGKDNGQEPGLWEIDLRSEFPQLFVPEKETRVIIPHSEAKEKCSDCDGRGEIPCPTCNAGQEPGFYKPNQMTQCLVCHGRGLIAHRDGSDTMCNMCNGMGKLQCVMCASRGMISCHACDGRGSVLTKNVALVSWRTLSNRKVSTTSGAASVPDEVFHKARGFQLYNTQAYQCMPAYFADSYLLNRFSSEIIAERSVIPPASRVICERHMISVVPVTRVTMSYRNKSFSFYIIGVDREVYIRDYPSKYCWGLCCCLEWLKI